MRINLLVQASTYARALTTLVATSLLICFSGESSSAQQDRQLTQNGSASPATASKRIALVIGNGAYTSAPPLKNPPNDARDMSASLRTLGFDVTSGINANQKDMKRLIREFGLKLKGGGSGLFYYAGHGVQSKGRNYLIPIDAEIQSEAEVEDSGVDASLVLNYMDDAQNGLNIVILDACRNNPFARSFRSASDGLAQVDAPTGTLIAYATAPGRVASDGTGQNGLYTSELLKQMRIPGLSATDMFMRVRAEVIKQTGNKQVPWEASSLVGSFYFSGQVANAAGSRPTDSPAKSSVDPAAIELSYWESIKNSPDAEDFRSYLQRYPTGNFVPLAQNRLKSLEATKSSAGSDSSKPSATSSGASIGSVVNSMKVASPYAECFREDLGAASTNWDSHHDWATKQDLQTLKRALNWKLQALFQCSSRTDDQISDAFAQISVIVARYVPNASCFNGNLGAVSTDAGSHRDWAKAKGRTAALADAQTKVLAALSCLDRSKQVSFYADLSVLVAGGR
jgi:hypothetical protein